MGIDYSFNLAVGFTVTHEKLYEVFGKEFPPKTHLEDRFNPKTGKKLPQQEEVTDVPGGFSLFFEGKGCIDEYTLANVICKKLKCSCVQAGSGMTDICEFVFGPSFEKVKNDDDLGFHISVGGGIPFYNLVKEGPELTRIGSALRKMKLIDDDAPAMVKIAAFVC